MGIDQADIDAILEAGENEDLGSEDNHEDEDLKKEDKSTEDPGKKTDEESDDENLDGDSVEALRRSIEDSYEEPVKKTEKKDEEKPSKFELNDESFFTGDVDKLQDLVNNPKGFNDLLNSIYKKAAEVGFTKATERVLRSMPEVIKAQITQQITLQTGVEKFYSDNKDLQPYKKTVAAVASQVAAARPDLPLPQLFKVTEQIARKKLNLIKKVEDKGGGEKKGTSFPKKPSGTRGKGEDKTPTGLSKEIDEMLKAI